VGRGIYPLPEFHTEVHAEFYKNDCWLIWWLLRWCSTV